MALTVNQLHEFQEYKDHVAKDTKAFKATLNKIKDIEHRIPEHLAKHWQALYRGLTASSLAWDVRSKDLANRYAHLNYEQELEDFIEVHCYGPKDGE